MFRCPFADHPGAERFPHIAVVIVTRNRRDSLLKVLSQVGRSDYPNDRIHIHLLDAYSTDGTAEKVRQLFPEAHLIEESPELGIAGVENVLISRILNTGFPYKYIWQLDDDAEIDESTLLPLVEAAESDPLIAIVGSAVYRPDQRDRLLTTGVRINWKKPGLMFHVPPQEKSDQLFDVEIVPACSSLSRIELYRDDRVGLWETRFRQYWPDNEWCLRASRAGYRVCCQGRSRVWHRNWVEVERYFSAPYSIYHSTRGALLFYARHCPPEFLLNIRKYVLKCYLKAAFEELTTRPNLANAYREGVQDFMRGYFAERNPDQWSNPLEIMPIEDLCKKLRGMGIEDRSSIFINEVWERTRLQKIKSTFEKYQGNVRWLRMSSSTHTGKKHIDESISNYLFHLLPRFLLSFLLPFDKKDLVLYPLETVELAHIAKARYTVFLDASMNATIQRNRPLHAFCRFFATLYEGVLAVCYRFPRALAQCQDLRISVSAHTERLGPSPSGAQELRTQVM